MSKIISIYQIRHVESGKIYVGSSSDTRQRWSVHLSRLRRNVHESRYLQKAWNKYGEQSFVFEIIEELHSIENLISREQYWIDTLHSIDRRYGFNLNIVANSSIGVKRSEETRRKLKQVRQKEVSNPIVHKRLVAQSREYWSKPESREKMRSMKLEHGRNPETRKKMADSQIRYGNQPNVREMRSLKGKDFYANNPERREILAEFASKEYILTAPNGEVYEIRNLKKFCQEHNLTARTMHRVMQGLQSNHKGWACRRK